MRLAGFFDEGHENYAIKLYEHFGIDEGIQLYGLGQQAYYGDQQIEEPSSFDFLAHTKWTAWESRKGKNSEEAQKEWLAFAIPLMEREGFPIEDPEKALIEREYEACIKEKLEKGATLEELELARKAYMDQ